MSEHEEYEVKCNLIREENRVLLDDFATWMKGKGLSAATVNKHLNNIDFYINEFLLYESPESAAEGVGDAGMFLGYWFIRKAMWASETTIISNAASIRKFYDFMLRRGAVEPGAVKEMKEGIKADLPEWLATLKRYEDPAVDMDDV